MCLKGRNNWRETFLSPSLPPVSSTPCCLEQGNFSESSSPSTPCPGLLHSSVQSSFLFSLDYGSSCSARFSLSFQSLCWLQIPPCCGTGCRSTTEWTPEQRLSSGVQDTLRRASRVLTPFSIGVGSSAGGDGSLLAPTCVVSLLSCFCTSLASGLLLLRFISTCVASPASPVRRKSLCPS